MIISAATLPSCNAACADTSILKTPAEKQTMQHPIVIIAEGCFICRVKQWHKKALRSSQDLNMNLLNSSQMLLPTEPLEVWLGAGDRWYLSIDTV